MSSSSCLLLTIILIASTSVDEAAIATDDCQFIETDGSEAMIKARSALDRLAPIRGQTFISEQWDTFDGRKATYSFSLCANPVPATCREQSSVVVVDSEIGNCTTLGLFNETQIHRGDLAISLMFSGGDDFTGPPCASVKRQSFINIVCDPIRKKGVLEVSHVASEGTASHCWYGFVLSIDVVCPSYHGGGQKSPAHRGLSSGSVLCIMFFTVVGVYLAFGVLYRRIVVRAKGIEQIPNYDFWRDFANLQADGCDFLCRCGGRQEAKMYQGIGSSRQDDDGDSEDRDDRLLPM